MGGPFATAAEELLRYGLAPIPCRVDRGDGKTPAIRFGEWGRPPSLDVVRRLIERFPDSNVAVVTGLSHITIVDIDAPDLVDDMLRRFGDTPLITVTPSSGRHLWYRSQGERNANWRSRERLPVDIRGVGGIAVVPPSRRPTGPHAGRLYEFERGSWQDVEHLPHIREGSLPTRSHVAPPRTEAAAKPPARQGERNDILFRRLIRQAPFCDSFEELLDVAQGWNSEFLPALGQSEVAKTVASVWRYQKENRNFFGQGSRIYHLVADVTKLAAVPHGSDAQLLVSVLRINHWDRPEFAASPDAMARDRVIPGWGQSPSRYRRALAVLVTVGILTIVKDGGRGPGDPRIFSFTSNGSSQSAAGGDGGAV